MLDLTVYLEGPSERELECLIDLYESICPSGSLVKYKIAELVYWPDLASPDLTASGRAAAAAGIPRPYIEPVRRRIRDGRGFELQYWDGRTISDRKGSWSFNSRRIHLRTTGLHPFVRILVPVNENPEILRKAAVTVAESIAFYSGHGGLVFVYDPWLLEDAFDVIYAQARRFWGVDVEHLNGTLPLMKSSIKGVSWVTMLGPKLDTEDSAAAIQTGLARLAHESVVTIDQRQHGAVIVAGPEPVPGDQHRPDRSLDPYYAVANALSPLFLNDHPDFPSERFVTNSNTVGWIRRFIDPAGWR
jgi:hypothetical protein